jgi:hypothetical protein
VHLERPCVYNHLLKEFLASVTATETPKEWQGIRKELEPSSTKLAAYVCHEFWLIPTQVCSVEITRERIATTPICLLYYCCCLRKNFLSRA